MFHAYNGKTLLAEAAQAIDLSLPGKDVKMGMPDSRSSKSEMR